MNSVYKNRGFTPPKNASKRCGLTFNKNVIEKIILCDVQKEIYPKLEKIFTNLLSGSGYPGVKFEKKIDFEQLYSQRLN